jgi:hypothetical protein
MCRTLLPSPRFGKRPNVRPSRLPSAHRLSALRSTSLSNMLHALCALPPTLTLVLRGLTSQTLFRAVMPKTSLVSRLLSVAAIVRSEVHEVGPSLYRMPVQRYLMPALWWAAFCSLSQKLLRCGEEGSHDASLPQLLGRQEEQDYVRTLQWTLRACSGTIGSIATGLSVSFCTSQSRDNGPHSGFRLFTAALHFALAFLDYATVFVPCEFVFR